MSSMTSPPSLMSGNTVKKVTKMSSTALMWIRSRLFLRWNNVWDSLSTSSMKRGPGPSPLESILVHAPFAPCDGGLFQKQNRSFLGGSVLSLVPGDFRPPPMRATLVATPETMGHYAFAHVVSPACLFITAH